MIRACLQLPTGHLEAGIQPTRRTLSSLRLCSSNRQEDHRGFRRLRGATDLHRRDHFSQSRANVSVLSSGTIHKSRVPPTILPHCPPARRFLRAQVNMALARSHSTHEHDAKQPNTQNGALKQRNVSQKPGTNQHAHEDNHDNDHAHSHSLFGHSHSHGEEGHSHDAEQIIAALKGTGELAPFSVGASCI